MNDDSRTISMTALTAVILWSISLGLLLLAIALLATSHPSAACVSALAAVVMAMMAVAAMCRCYTIRVCSLIRATSGLNHPTPQSVGLAPVP